MATNFLVKMGEIGRLIFIRRLGIPKRILFCSLFVLVPRVGHTMDVISPFISVLCHSD